MKSRKNSKFGSRVKKIYHSMGYNNRYESMHEFMKDCKWIKRHQNGGSPYKGYGKRMDEKRIFRQAKSDVRKCIDCEIVEYEKDQTT